MTGSLRKIGVALAARVFRLFTFGRYRVARIEAVDEGNPFLTFVEWHGEADEKAYESL